MSLQMAKFHSFIWLSSIPFHICMYHIFFFYSSVYGHFGLPPKCCCLRLHFERPPSPHSQQYLLFVYVCVCVCLMIAIL